MADVRLLEDGVSRRLTESGFFRLLETITVPGAPTGFTATGFSTSQMNLVWVAPSDGGSPITGYLIRRRTPGGTWGVLVADTGNDDTNYADTGLPLYTAYEYDVAAINAIGTGLASDPDSGRTLTDSVGGSVITDDGQMQVSVPVGDVTDLTNRWFFTSVNTYDFALARSTFDIGNLLEDFFFSSILRLIVGTARDSGYRVTISFWVDGDGNPKVIIDLVNGSSSPVTLDLDWSTHKYWSLYNEGPTTWSIWSSENKTDWDFRLRGEALLPTTGAERLMLECYRDNTAEEDDTTTVFKISGVNCPQAGDPLPEGRIRRGLVAYFVPGTVEFDPADWEQSVGPAAPSLNGSDHLLIMPGTDSVHRAYRLTTAPDLTGLYITALVRQPSTSNKRFGPALVADVTAGSVDSSGGTYEWSGGTLFWHAGPQEIIAGTEIQHGTESSNFSRLSNWWTHVWVEESAVFPLCKVSYRLSSGGVLTHLVSEGPLSRQISGKPGGVTLGVSGAAAFEHFEWYCRRNRYVTVRGLQPGRVAVIRNSGGVTRFGPATANALGVAVIDTYGDETPLLNYDVAVYEAGGITLVRVEHPLDDDGVVWGGDMYNLP